MQSCILGQIRELLFPSRLGLQECNIDDIVDPIPVVGREPPLLCIETKKDLRLLSSQGNHSTLPSIKHQDSWLALATPRWVVAVEMARYNKGEVGKEG